MEINNSKHAVRVFCLPTNKLKMTCALAESTSTDCCYQSTLSHIIYDDSGIVSGKIL